MTAPTSGTRPDDARRHNRAALLRRLHVDGPCTRATLATELGLNRSTIKAVVDGLAEAGVVTEAVPTRRSGAGRPSLLVLPEPQSAVVLAVDIRVDQVAMAMVGIGGQILASLVTRREDEWTGLPLASRRVPGLPPEPLKRFGGGLVRAAILTCEEHEEDGRSGPLYARAVAALPRLTGMKIGTR